MTASPPLTDQADAEANGRSAPYFNLVEEPWLPAIRTDGTQEFYSLRGVFDSAQDIRRLHGDLPTMQPAILRILITVMSRAVGLPGGASDWLALTADWATVAESVDRYLTAHKDRFWLRHPVEPFFQVADLGPESGDTKDLGAIVADYPANVTFFTQRGPRSLEAMEPAEAARWLVHAHQYDTSGIKTPDRRDPRAKGGRVYPNGTGWMGKGEVLIAHGPTLADTLRLHLISPTVLGVEHGIDDLPPWERPHPGPVEEFSAPAVPAGFLQVYTWQTRRVRLVFSGEVVTQVVLCYGDPLHEQNRQQYDPMMTWRYSKPQSTKAKTTVYMPGIVDPRRDAWRGMTAWLPTATQDTTNNEPNHLEPGVLRWIGHLHRELAVPLSFKPAISVYGIEYGPQSSTFAEVLEDYVDVPPFLLTDDATDQAITVRHAIADADTVAWYLGTFATNLAKARGVDIAEGLRDEAKTRAYLTFGRRFTRWLDVVAVPNSDRPGRAVWQQALRQDAEFIAEELADAAGPSAYIGRRVSAESDTWITADLARRYLMHGLRKTLPLAFEETKNESAER